MRICNKWSLSTVSLLSLFKETLGYVKQVGTPHPNGLGPSPTLCAWNFKIYRIFIILYQRSRVTILNQS